MKGFANVYEIGKKRPVRFIELMHIIDKVEQGEFYNEILALVFNQILYQLPPKLKLVK